MTQLHEDQYTALMNDDNEIVGLFRSSRSVQAARAEWAEHYTRLGLQWTCRSVVRTMRPKSVVDVLAEEFDAGDGDRSDVVLATTGMYASDGRRWTDHVGERVELWHRRGAEIVEVRRYVLDAWRRPGKSWAERDLGGFDVAEVGSRTVLFRLVIKVPKRVSEV